MDLFAWFLIALALIAVVRRIFAAPRAPTEKERAAAQNLGRAIHEALPLGSVAGQGGWDFGAPPPSAPVEPEGENVLVVEPPPDAGTRTTETRSDAPSPPGCVAAALGSRQTPSNVAG